MAADLTTNLEAHYACDDGTGTTLADSTGSHSATWTSSTTYTNPGMVGSYFAAPASASTQRASVATWAGIQGTGAKTIAFWFKTTTATGGILSFGTNAAGQACRIELEAGVLWMRCATGTGQWAGGLNDGAWHHVVFVKPASATMNGVLCYIDGVARTGTFGSGTTSLNWGSANPLYIGWDWGGTAGYWNGGLDDIYFFSRELSAEDRDALFELGTPNIEGPSGYWKLDETSGITAADSSGNGYHGTHTNTPTLGVDGAINRSYGAYFNSASTEYATGMSLVHASTNTMSFAAWIKCDGTQSAYAGVAFSRGATVNGLNFDSAGSKKLAYTWNNNAGTYNWTGGPTLTDLTWTHVLVCISAACGTVYVNGEWYNTNVVANTAIANPFTALELGRDSFGTRAYKGSLDEVRIYPRTLGGLDARYLYQYKPPRRRGSMFMAGSMFGR